MKGLVVGIVGPTATGKSDLANKVALELSCPVISCDSMQIYRGMDIGTAKATPEERTAGLEMVDVCDVADDYSVRLYQEQARRCVDASLEKSGFAVLCGGTGLYLDAVLDELVFPVGEKRGDTRRHFEDYLEEHGSDALWELLKERDPESAELIHPNNSKRVVRALEMLESGSSYADSTTDLHTHEPHYPSRIWALTMDRERLYARIDARVDDMFENGLVDEVRSLVQAGLTREVTAGQAIGYKEVLDFLEGECTLEEATEEVKKRSRRYAKRQLTWFRRDERVSWVDLDTMSVEDACRLIVSQARGELDG